MTIRHPKKQNLFKAEITCQDIQSVDKILSRGVLARGEATRLFERAFADYTGAKYAVAVASGTAALHLAVRSLGWGKGDGVITSPFTFVACSNCLLYENAEPIYADIEQETFNLDFKSADKLVNSKIKGILLPHVFGAVCDLEAFRWFQKRHNLPVIEDACEAIGRPDEHFPVGKFGKIRTYSFFENKPLTCGEGGMMVTNDAYLAEKLKSMRNQGRLGTPDWLDNIDLGYNYRMTEMQAALGLSQLRRLDQSLKKRAQLAKIYEKELIDVPGIQTPADSWRSWFLYYIIVKNPAQRLLLNRNLNKRSIETSLNYFHPLYRFSHLRKFAGNQKIAEIFPVTEWATQRILVLPFYNQMNEADVKKICGEIKNIVSKCPKF